MKMKIRLVPMGMAIQIARARRSYKHMSCDVSLERMLLHVPFRWFDESCYLRVEDIDDDGNFGVLDFETGEEYSIPAWMVSDIVKVKEDDNG